MTAFNEIKSGLENAINYINTSRFKQIRQAANMSVSQMAKYLGVGDRMVRYYESGGREPGGAVKKLYGMLEQRSTALPLILPDSAFDRN